MKRSQALAWLACALLWAAPVCVTAQESAVDEERRRERRRENRLLEFFRATEVDGYVDVYYSFNFNRPFDGRNALRAFDDRHRRLSLNAIGLAFEKQPDPASRLGYRLDLIFGPAADYLASGEPRRAETYRYFHQAYVSYLAPAGKGLQLDFGKMIAWSGVESDRVVENWSYTLGLVSLGQPGYHTGLRATYAFGPRFSLTGAVVNGWDNVEENNGGKTFGLSATLGPAEGLSLTQNYTVGPEQPGDTRSLRHFFDTVVTYEIGERVSLVGNYDYGLDRLTDGSRVRWQGVMAALRYAPSRRFALSPRVEWFRDYDGFITDTPQRLKEVTLTGEYRVGRGLLARLEYRRDWSDQHVFPTADASVFRRTQTTLTSGFIWAFDTRGREAAQRDDATPEPPPATPPAVTPAAARARRPARPAPRAWPGPATLRASFSRFSPFRFVRVEEVSETPAPAHASFRGNLFGGQ